MVFFSNFIVFDIFSYHLGLLHVLKRSGEKIHIYSIFLKKFFEVFDFFFN
jgi:hypothetical protein